MHQNWSYKLLTGAKLIICSLSWISQNIICGMICYSCFRCENIMWHWYHYNLVLTKLDSSKIGRGNSCQLARISSYYAVSADNCSTLSLVSSITKIMCYNCVFRKELQHSQATFWCVQMHLRYSKLLREKTKVGSYVLALSCNMHFLIILFLLASFTKSVKGESVVIVITLSVSPCRILFLVIKTW